ncbi:hypothetical protein Efla_005221 [Eimeria flavescens]
MTRLGDLEAVQRRGMGDRVKIYRREQELDETGMVIKALTVERERLHTPDHSHKNCDPTLFNLLLQDRHPGHLGFCCEEPTRGLLVLASLLKPVLLVSSQGSNSAFMTRVLRCMCDHRNSIARNSALRLETS